VTQAVPVPSSVSQSSDRLQLPTERPRRTNVGTYKDGPARLRSTANEADVVGEDKKDFRSGKERFRAKLAYIHEFNNPHGIFSVIALKMSLRNALNDPNRRSAIQKAIYAEIDNFESPGVVQPIKFKNIPKDKLKEIIGVYMFHREKYKGDGIFDKDKCRIVLLSNLRDPDTIGDSTSPTVNPISVMTQINLAAVTEGTCIAAYDIKGAFLLTPMKPGVRMFIRINPDVATHWIMRYPERAKWLQNDGCLYFELNRYVYGLHEASNEFNSMLDKQLQDIGFKPSVADRCLYTKKVEDGIIVMSVHVDDMLLTAPNRKWQKWFEDEMEKKFTLVKQYDNISYLGMQIKHDRESGNITVSQNGYLRTMLKKYKLDNLNKFPPTSASENLTDIDHDSPPTNKKEYLSLVMSLMYLARFTRPDINFVVSYLATKSSAPTEQDSERLMRVLRYLAGTKNDGLLFSSSVPFKPAIYADASHHLYPEGHGQQGMIITCGSAPVAHRSVKIKMITRSSSESELCALEDASTYSVWYRLLLNDMGVDSSKPIATYQDNKSTIIMAATGATFKRTKHLISKFSYVKERIDNGDIQLKYMPTKDMIADILTKPVDRATLVHLRQKMSIFKI
jgi:hypothetical protein